MELKNMYDSKKIKLQKFVFNSSEIDNDVDPKLKALAAALIQKGVITKQDILNKL